MTQKVVVVDTEGDGLSHDQPNGSKAATKFWVMGWTYDGSTVETTFRDTDMATQLYKWRREGYLICCHNAIRHDHSLFKRILGVDLPYEAYIDTLALSWTLNPSRAKHGLAGYGEDFGIPKPEVEFWEPQEGQTMDDFLGIMKARVTEDTLINYKLWVSLESKLKELYGET